MAKNSAAEAEENYSKRSGKNFSAEEMGRLTRARQEENMRQTRKMLDEGVPEGISASDLKKRMDFMTESMAESRKQKILDDFSSETDTGDETQRLLNRSPQAKPRPYETPYDRMNRENRETGIQFKKGGVVSASKRADGIAQRGKTRGTIVMCGGGMYKK